MNGKEILADTNILLYLLKGDDTIAQWLQNRLVYISFITELEMLGYNKITKSEQKQIKSLIANCKVISINENIKKLYVFIRQQYNLKLADSIIAATAVYLQIPLITADKQIARLEKETEIILYKI